MDTDGSSSMEIQLEGLIEGEQSSLTSSIYTMPLHCSMILETMNNHRKECSKLCDVILRIGNTQIPSHKAVLASCSSYFFAMFNGELSESRQKIVTIKDVEAPVMEALVEFSYSGCIEITVENVQTLLSTASLVQFHEVRDLCCQFLESQLDPSNCLGIRKFIEAHGCLKFLETIDKYVLENFKSVLKSEEYALLPMELLVKVISSDDLNVLLEEDVYEAVMTWIRHDLNNRVSKLPLLIRFVRMPLIRRNYLVDVIGSDSLIRSNLTCRDMLDEAKNCYLKPDQGARFRSDRMKPRKAMAGILFAVGGKEAGETISNTMESFNLQSNKWQESASLNVPRQQLGVASICTRLYAVGGSDGFTRLSSVESFNPETNKWTYIKPLNTSRSGVGLGVIGETLYALGGYDGRSCLKTVERYDPQVDLWSSVASINVTRSFPGVAEAGGRLYVIGGNDGVSFLNSVECYDPLTNKWMQVPPLSHARAGIGATALDGTLFAIGGFDGIQRLDIVEMYESRMEKWTKVSPLKSCRDGVCVATFGGHIFAVGGIDGPSYLNTVEAYDPKTDEWEEMSPMSKCRAAAGVAVLQPHHT